MNICPTCAQPLSHICQDDYRTVWHCSRCGTLATRTLAHEDVVLPGLVNLCRIGLTEFAGPAWFARRLQESIYPPELRQAACK